MEVPSILAVISSVILVLHMVACIPAAVAEVIRACESALNAWTALRSTSNATALARDHQRAVTAADDATA